MKVYSKDIANIAKESEQENFIDWSIFNMDRDSVYELMASDAIDMYNKLESNPKEIILLACITHLLVENFVLNTKLGLMD